MPQFLPDGRYVLPATQQSPAGAERRRVPTPMEQDLVLSDAWRTLKNTGHPMDNRGPEMGADGFMGGEMIMPAAQQSPAGADRAPVPPSIAQTLALEGDRFQHAREGFPPQAPPQSQASMLQRALMALQGLTGGR